MSGENTASGPEGEIDQTNPESQPTMGTVNQPEGGQMFVIVVCTLLVLGLLFQAVPMKYWRPPTKESAKLGTKEEFIKQYKREKWFDSETQLGENKYVHKYIKPLKWVAGRGTRVIEKNSTESFDVLVGRVYDASADTEKACFTLTTNIFQRLVARDSAYNYEDHQYTLYEYFIYNFSEITAHSTILSLQLLASLTATFTAFPIVSEWMLKVIFRAFLWMASAPSVVQ